MFGNIIASMSAPEIKQQASEYKSEKFFGRIWIEHEAVSEVSLKFVDVGNGTVVYSAKQKDRRFLLNV